MAQLNEAFDHNVVAAETGYDPMPPGDYMLMITQSDYTDTAKGNGKVLKLTSQVVDGQFEGRKIFENLCLEHENPKTVQIAKAKFSALCKALQIKSAVRDSNELHDKPYFASIGVEDGEGKYGAKNVIKKYIFDKPETTNSEQTSQSATHGAAPVQKSAAWDK